MIDEVTLEVEYSCNQCNLRWRKVTVRERHGMAENVVAWVRMIQEAVGVDHKKMSPNCLSPHCDLKIPLTHGGYIGQAQRQ